MPNILNFRWRFSALPFKMVLLAFLVLSGGIIVVGTVAFNAPSTQALFSRAWADGVFTLLYKPSLESIAVTPSTGNARSIPVLLYHGESGGPDMSTGVFVDQMRAMKADGWQTITMEQFDQWEKGQIQLPDKSFLLTFDDGRKDTYYPVDPVLQALGYNAVMFVITGFSMPSDGLQSDFYLNKTELQEMVDSGRWELESHGDLDHALYAVQSTTDLSQAASTTQGHFLSNKFWDTSTNAFETNAEFTQRITNDLQTSKQTLEQDFGSNVIGFAYPFNDYGDDSVNFPGSQAILDKAVPSIYTYGFYQTWPQNGDTFNYPETNNGPGSAPYMIKRIEPPVESGAALVQMLDEGRAKSIPYTSTSFGDDWVLTWGALTDGASLSLSATPKTSGGSAFLNGSNGWTNYLFTATFQGRTPGTSLSLLARNSDDRNYVECAFSQGSVDLETHVDDIQYDVARGSYDFTAVNGNVGIGVYGSEIICYVNGVAVVSGYSAAPVLQKGGVGIEVWNKTIGVASVQISDVSVGQFSGVAVSPAPKTTTETAADGTQSPTTVVQPAQRELSAATFTAAPALAPSSTTTYSTSTPSATSTRNFLTNLLQQFNDSAPQKRVARR